MSEPRRAAHAGAWGPYIPDAENPWDLRRVAHLHRRAGFAATWDEIQRDLKDGPKASISRILAGKASGQGVPDGFERDAAALANAAVAARDPEQLKGWWVYRMLFSPDPLAERLTLLWHCHFATSNLKVEDVAAMRRQNETFRRLARAPFGELLTAALRDPALLFFLDAPANRKGHPNENLARELMELFTLGIGHYSEDDVKEGARALTGWSLRRTGDFREVEAEHDGGFKTVLGRKGRWKGADLVRMLLEHPATASRLAWRVCELFMGEGAADAAAVRALADGLRQHQLDVAWAVETVLRSRAFFAEANLGTRIRGPVEHLIGVARALQCHETSLSTQALADWAARLGQDLFYPPNVGGWAGGRTWLSTGAVIGRANFGAALVGGEVCSDGRPLDLKGLARRHGRGEDFQDFLGFYAELLLGCRPGKIWRERLGQAVQTKTAPDDDAARRAVVLLLASPEAQLG